MSESKVEIGKTDKFGITGRLRTNLYALLAMPAGLLLGTGIGMFFISIVEKSIFLLIMSLISFSLCVLILNIYPIFAGETYLNKIVRNKTGFNGNDTDSYLSEIAFIPKIQRGISAFLDNADDIGKLQLTKEEILFIGDYVNLKLRYLEIAKLDRKSCGWRGLWIYGSWIIIFFVSPIDNFTGIKLFIRGRKTILSTRKTANEVFEKLKRIF